MTWRKWLQPIAAEIESAFRHGSDPYVPDYDIKRLVDGFRLCAEAVEAAGIGANGEWPDCGVYGNHAAGCKIGAARDFLRTVGEECAECDS